MYSSTHTHTSTHTCASRADWLPVARLRTFTHSSGRVSSQHMARITHHTRRLYAREPKPFFFVRSFDECSQAHVRIHSVHTAANASPRMCALTEE